VPDTALLDAVLFKHALVMPIRGCQVEPVHGEIQSVTKSGVVQLHLVI